MRLRVSTSLGTLLIPALFLLVGCQEPVPQEFPNLIECDAETVIESTEGLSFDCGNWLLSKGVTQSEDHARSGRFSCKVDSVHRYGFGVVDSLAMPGDRYHVSVWCKGSGGKLVVTDKESTSFYIKSQVISTPNDNGWSKHSTIVTIPPHVGQQSMCAFVWNPGDSAVYFDDFRVEKLGSFVQKSDLEIELSPDALKTLCQYRDSARSRGQITADLKEWINAQVISSGRVYKAKIRLKGDWIDHILGYKWSLRIRLKDDALINGINTFSIQAPEVRSFMDEWVFHQACEAENILTTKYDFAKVSINGCAMGVYAVEEHFADELLTQKGRAAGPILKFEEDLFFWRLRNGPKVSSPTTLPWLRHAGITTFKSSRLSTDLALKAEFERAQDLLDAYRNFSLPTGEIFDVESFACATVLTDIFRAHHSARWHNQRFFYNDELDRLELVMYDGFGTGGQFDPKRHAVAVSPPRVAKDLTKLEKDPLDLNGVHLHLNIDALEHYQDEVSRMCDSTYIADFESRIKTEFDEALALVREDFPDYQYDFSKISESAGRMKKTLRALNMSGRLSADSLVTFQRFPSEISEAELPIIMAQAYFSEDTLTVVNFSAKQIQMAMIDNDHAFTWRPQDAILVEQFRYNQPAPFVQLKLDFEPKTVTLQMGDEQTVIEVKPWRPPSSPWVD